MNAMNSKYVEGWVAGVTRIRKRRWFRVYPCKRPRMPTRRKGGLEVRGVEILPGEVWLWVVKTYSGRPGVGWSSNMAQRFEELCFRPSGMPKGGRVVWMQISPCKDTEEAFRRSEMFRERWKLPRPKPPRAPTVPTQSVLELPPMPPMEEEDRAS